MNYIGIDNGITGGLAAIRGDGKPIWLKPMPIQRTKKGNEIDVRAVKNWLDGVLLIHDTTETIVVIEEPAGSKFPKMASSMAGSFHAIRTVLELMGLAYERVTPQAWQKVMLGKLPKGQTKIAALTRARSLFPKQSWLETPRCTKPHDGMVDAALIAEFGRRNNL